MDRPTLGFALRLGVRVPEYEGDESFRADHYEGSVLFADKLNIEVEAGTEGPLLRYGWDRRTPNHVSRSLSLVSAGENGPRVGQVPFGSSRDVRPGVQGTIRLTLEAWNV